MKKVLIIFMAVFPFLCCAGRSHGAAEPPFVADTLSGAGEAAATDRIRIRFADTVPLPREARFAAGAADTGIGWFDRALDTVGAVEVRRVFSDGGRFAERRRRYGLHLWYEVRTDGRMPVAEVVQVFAVCRIRVPGRTCGLAAGGMCSDRGIRTIGGQTGVKYIYEWDKYTK